MDAREFEACLGSVDDSPEVVQLLASLGINTKLKPAKDDQTIVLLKNLGLQLAFERENNKSSKLKLIEVHFYSNVSEGYTSFSGTLPYGITFNDTQEDVIKKLGKPTESMAAYRMDHWVTGNRRCSVKYSKASGRVAIIFWGFPIKG